MIHLYVQQFNYVGYELYTLMHLLQFYTHSFIRINAFDEKKNKKNMGLLFMNSEPNDKT